ncbi:sodium/proton antiporter (CPA1 family) [Streptohalobacillus salinus]|uniref:Sodium/proton antiporter (CPA1 family) n=1 Tax=Streptohalobacillus salinus TaxID=621096 RepID=A0A2V3WEW8_9BACI|nr:cation:proton antiporter [Streptohalobacillus salinus]PXW93193.1 sodium/proton antiporter (CPA1 family) [Streptohalobacillus salinus]
MLESIAILLLGGFIAGMVMTKFNLPPLLGMLVIGVLFGPYMFDWLGNDLLHISPEIRTFSLMVILIRAGLGIHKHEIQKVGWSALKMSSIPSLMEGFAVTALAYFFFNFSFAEAGMLGFILAAVSPAVVVPSMLELKEARLGEDKQIPTLLLAGTSIDDVFAITLFTFFLGLGTSGGESIVFSLLKIPFSIIVGVMIGLVIGLIFVKLFDFKKFLKSNSERLLLVLSGAIFFYHFGEQIGIASLLGIMTLGFMIVEKRPEVAKGLSKQLLGIWVFAQILLFSLVGAAVDIDVAFQAGLMGLVIIGVGLMFRTLGVVISLIGTNLNRRERLFCVFSYWPKATVQAAIGGIPLASGVGEGGTILAIAVLSILLTAPMGAILIKKTAPLLLTRAKEQ